MATGAAEKGREITAEAERLASGPMTEAEVRLLRDMQAFIEFGLRNGLGFASVLGVLGRDITSIISHGMSYEDALSQGFLPKVSGYSEITTDSVGEPAESAE